jgi:outer membrane lipoprotein-sorting protein
MKKVLIAVLGLLVGLVFSCGKEATVDDVVTMMTKAMGGEQTLAAISDQVSKWDFTMHQMPPMPPAEGQADGQQAQASGPHTMPMTITYKRPNKIRFDSYGPDGALAWSSCYDGTKGWSMMMGQTKDANEAQNQESEAMVATWIDGYLNYKDKGFTLALLPAEMMEGNRYMVLQVTDKHGNVQKIYINETTHLLEKQTGDMTNMEGAKEPMYMTFKNYTMMDGVNMAQHVASYKADGTIIWEATLKEAKHNTGVDDSVFMANAM